MFKFKKIRSYFGYDSGRNTRGSSRRLGEYLKFNRQLEYLEARDVPANFTPGDIAVLDLAAASGNTTGSILELNPTTVNQSSTVQTIGISSIGSNAMRFSDSGTSSYLSTTDDGTLLTLAAYNTTDSIDAAIENSPASDRAVATLDSGANFTIQTTYTGTAGNQTRSATSNDDSNWYITDKGGLYTDNVTKPSLTTNILNARSFGGTVFVSSTKASSAISTVSSPSATTLTALSGIPGDGSINDFYLIQSGVNGAAYDILYTVSGATVKKFSLVDGTWNANGSATLSASGLSMIAQNNGDGGADLYY
ncbi:MAG TPA: hypothetical protein VGL71_11320, partial [Urbifossiella sp.]